MIPEETLQDADETARGKSTDHVRIGLAGWSYPDWRGTFYPKSRSRDFSELRYAAERFDTLEINSSFYRFPEQSHSSSWLETVRDIDKFTFTAKLTRDLTHARTPPRDIHAMCSRFMEGLQPLQEAHRLDCILAQFPWYFQDSSEHRDLIASIAAGLSPAPVAVEIRHNSFLDSGPDGALPFFGRHGINFVNIDLPLARTSIPLTSVNTGPISYVRLHGRNATAWFDPGAKRDDKYNYLYSITELEQLFPVIVRLARRTQAVYVIANNHFRAQAPANARQLIQMLGRKPKESAQLQSQFSFLSEPSSRESLE